MRATWLALVLAVGCRANLPDPVEPLARTPDAEFRRGAPKRLPGTPPARLPPVRVERLANGLFVIVATRPNNASTSVELVVRGAGSDSSDAGSIFPLATVYALAEAPEAIIRSDVEDDAAYLGIDTDETGLDGAVKDLADAVLRPRIGDEVIHSTQTYLSQRAGGGAATLVSIVYERLYAEPPAALARGMAALGVTKAAILKQYDLHYGPENAALIVSGPALFERVQSLAVEHFGAWQPGGRSAPKPPGGLPLLVPSLGQRPIIAVDMDADMAFALLILPGPPNGFPGFPEYLLTDVLIGNSLGSRGNVALRLHDAKTYGVWSALERHRARTELGVYFFVEQDDFVESLERMFGEVERLRAEPLSNEELEIAKIAWRARLSSRLMTNQGTVALLREGFALEGDPAALGTIAESVERVRPADVQAVARREFTRDRMQVVVLANRKRTGTGLLRLGPIWWHKLEAGGLGPAE